MPYLDAEEFESREEMYSRVEGILRKRGYTVDEGGEEGPLYSAGPVTVEETEKGVEITADSSSEAQVIAGMLEP